MIVPLLLVVLLQLVVLLVLLHQRKHSLSSGLCKDIVSVATLDMRGKLTNVRWFSEMMLEGDNGELTIAQIEFVHQMNAATCEAINHLAAIIDALEGKRASRIRLQYLCDNPLVGMLRHVRGLLDRP